MFLGFAMNDWVGFLIGAAVSLVLTKLFDALEKKYSFSKIKKNDDDLSKYLPSSDDLFEKYCQKENCRSRKNTFNLVRKV